MVHACCVCCGARSNERALQEACTERLLRMGRRRADLRGVAARLKQGARELRASAEQDNAFYQQVRARPRRRTAPPLPA